MKTLYFDCFAGASGDMILGALASLGIKDALLSELSKLGLPETSVEFSSVDRSGINAVKATVLIPQEHKHRHLHHIVEIINEASLSESVKQRAIAIFTRLAEAEAAVHGIDIQKVHFHEVGALDAIVDVVGACIGFDLLGIDRFVCSPIHVGSGFVNMEHGKFPVPPPAVAKLLESANITIYSTEIEGELMTPTGAAIISTLCTESGKLRQMTVEKTGYGAGGREYDKFPNVLRIVVGEAGGTSQSDNLVQLETNIDDMTPENLGFVMEKALDSGALDCWFTPIQMKKSRPAVMLSILCRADDREKFASLILSETTSIGVRITEVERMCLERELKTVSTSLGEVRVKVARRDDQVINVKPEFEDIKRISTETGLPFRIVSSRILKEIDDK